MVTPYNEILNPTPPPVINYPSPPYPNENKAGTVGDDIQTTKAWDLETGSKNVVVAVLDSGIDLTHPDLIPNIWTNPLDTVANGDNGDGFPDDVNGWNFVGSNNNVQDDYGHGTGVSGIIGAEGNNSLGVTGVDWNVSLLTVKVADASGTVSDANEIAGINYCVTLKDLANPEATCISTSDYINSSVTMIGARICCCCAFTVEQNAYLASVLRPVFSDLAIIHRWVQSKPPSQITETQ